MPVTSTKTRTAPLLGPGANRSTSGIISSASVPTLCSTSQPGEVARLPLLGPAPLSQSTSAVFTHQKQFQQQQQQQQQQPSKHEAVITAQNQPTSFTGPRLLQSTVPTVPGIRGPTGSQPLLSTSSFSNPGDSQTMVTSGHQAPPPAGAILQQQGQRLQAQGLRPMNLQQQGQGLLPVASFQQQSQGLRSNQQQGQGLLPVASFQQQSQGLRSNQQQGQGLLPVASFQQQSQGLRSNQQQGQGLLPVASFQQQSQGLRSNLQQQQGQGLRPMNVHQQQGQGLRPTSLQQQGQGLQSVNLQQQQGQGLRPTNLQQQGQGLRPMNLQQQQGQGLRPMNLQQQQGQGLRPTNLQQQGQGLQPMNLQQQQGQSLQPISLQQQGQGLQPMNLQQQQGQGLRPTNLQQQGQGLRPMNLQQQQGQSLQPINLQQQGQGLQPMNLQQQPFLSTGLIGQGVVQTKAAVLHQPQQRPPQLIIAPQPNSDAHLYRPFLLPPNPLLQSGSNTGGPLTNSSLQTTRPLANSSGVYSHQQQQQQQQQQPHQHGGGAVPVQQTQAAPPTHPPNFPRNPASNLNMVQPVKMPRSLLPTPQRPPTAAAAVSLHPLPSPDNSHKAGNSGQLDSFKRSLHVKNSARSTTKTLLPSPSNHESCPPPKVPRPSSHPATHAQKVPLLPTPFGNRADMAFMKPVQNFVNFSFDQQDILRNFRA